MSKTVWHKGPPPSVGWWPASMSRDKTLLRWWDGKSWSNAMWSGRCLDEALFAASRLSTCQEKIEWTERPDDWPERSRT